MAITTNEALENYERFRRENQRLRAVQRLNEKRIADLEEENQNLKDELSYLHDHIRAMEDESGLRVHRDTTGDDNPPEREGKIRNIFDTAKESSSWDVPGE